MSVPHAVLITGGAGFIGSHLADYFVRLGSRVLCLDNFLTGSRENIKHLLKHKSFRLIQHDITKPILLKDRIRLIFHFASPASPADYMRYPIKTLKVGSLGTHNSLGLAKEKKAAYVLASTSEVYGDPQVHPQVESYWGHVNCIGPRGVYDEAKRFAEALTMAYHREHDMDTRIVRIFNTYGPRVRRDDGRAIPNFITQALANQPVTLYGNGMQTRSFCFVSDLVEGILRLMGKEYHDPVNLGNPEERTLLELAQCIIRLTGSSSPLVFKPLPVDDPKRRRPDITRARELLDWSPVVPLEKGLSETIAWFR